MNYQELKDYLLSKRSLTEEVAPKILKTWRAKPKMYYDFLRNQGASKHLEAYVGVPNDDALGHQFLSIKTQVPSTDVAEKFFQLDNEYITDDFLSVIDQLSKERNDVVEICAWPYLEERCTRYLQFDNIKKIITGWHYLFNFENDENGYLFNYFYKQMQTLFWRDLLAANSVNLFGWVKNASQYEFSNVSRHFLMAEHCMSVGVNFEAFCRKYYINYRVDIENQQQLTERKFYHQETVYEC